MIINYRTQTICRGDRELNQGEDVIVRLNTKDVFLKTLSLGVHYTYQDEYYEFHFDTQEGARITLTDPVNDPQDLQDTLDYYKNNYLKFPDSFVSQSTVRPYGVGIDYGSVTKAPVKVLDIMDSIIEQYDVFFSPPTYTRDNYENVSFWTKKPFRFPYTDEAALPMFCDESFMDRMRNSDILGEKTTASHGATQLIRAFPHKQVKAVNNGYSLNDEGVKIRKWYSSHATANADDRTISNLKRELISI